MDPKPIDIKYAVKMVSEDEETFTVGGMGVVFGGQDLYGDQFNKSTDFMQDDMSATPPVLFDHAQGEIKGVIGSVVKMELLDAGIWFESQIEKSKEYAAQILELVQSGRLGYSTGTVGHLAEKLDGMIKRWPIAELSLTTSPAEPRTLGVEFLKGIGLQVPELLPGTESAESGNAKPEVAIPIVANTSNIKTNEVKTIMTDEQRAAMEVKFLADEKAAVEAAEAKRFEDAVGVAVKGYIAAQTEQTPEGGILTKSAAIKKVSEVGGSHDGSGEFKHWMRTGQENHYTKSQQPTWDEPSGGGTKAAYAEGGPTTGGVLVPKDLYAQIIEKRDETSIPHAAGALIINTSRDSISVPAENASAAFALKAEAAAVAESEGTLLDDTVTVYKWTALSKASTEVLEDEAANLDQWIVNMFGRAAADVYNQYSLVGTGSGQPEGIFVGGTAISPVAAATGALTAAELITAYHDLPSPYADGASWITRNSTLGSLRALTSNPFSFNPTPQGDQASGGLYGKDVHISDHVPAMAANVKAIAICNWNYYSLVERSGMTISRNPYLYEANDQVGFFARIRWGGMVSIAEAIQYLPMAAS